MKRGDYLIIGITVLFIILFMGLYINERVKKTSNQVGVFFQNKKVLNFECTDKVQAKIEIATTNKKVILKYYVNNSLKEEKVLAINYSKEIKNVLEMKGGVITMTESNCPHHECQKIRLSSKYTLPIVCTNEIIVRFLKNNPKDIEVVS